MVWSGSQCYVFIDAAFCLLRPEQPLEKLIEFDIPEEDLGVYTAAKLDWQFRMACDGNFDPAE